LIGERLEVIPARGRVVLAAPGVEERARIVAIARGLPYVVAAMCPPGTIYVLDVELLVPY
jgi:hypothetical protein